MKRRNKFTLSFKNIFNGNTANFHAFNRIEKKKQYKNIKDISSTMFPNSLKYISMEYNDYITGKAFIETSSYFRDSLIYNVPKLYFNRKLRFLFKKRENYLKAKNIPQDYFLGPQISPTGNFVLFNFNCEVANKRLILKVVRDNDESKTYLDNLKNHSEMLFGQWGLDTYINKNFFETFVKNYEKYSFFDFSIRNEVSYEKIKKHYENEFINTYYQKFDTDAILKSLYFLEEKFIVVRIKARHTEIYEKGERGYDFYLTYIFKFSEELLLEIFDIAQIIDAHNLY